MKLNISLILFVTTSILIWFAMHFYAWVHLVKRPLYRKSCRIAGTVLFIILFVVSFASMGIRTLQPGTWTIFFKLISYVWIGLLFLFVILCFIVDGSRMLKWFISLVPGKRKEKSSLTSPDRRVLLSRAAAGVVSLSGIGLASQGMHSAYNDILIQKKTVPLKNLPTEFEGLKIVQLSDLHLGYLLRREFVEYITERTNELKPDLVAITGDLLELPLSYIGDSLKPLRNLKSTYGTFFVTGNHDFYQGYAKWNERLQDFGFNDVGNRLETIKNGNSHLHVAGVQDPAGMRFGATFHPDMKKALEVRTPETPVVLLAHQPLAIGEASHLNVDLQLSGHTHGGQIWPFGLAVMMSQPYLSGLHNHNGTYIYVSRGTGFWGPPIRLFAPAEISQITLTNA